MYYFIVNNIPWKGSITLFFFTHQVIEIWVVHCEATLRIAATPRCRLASLWTPTSCSIITGSPGACSLTFRRIACGFPLCYIILYLQHLWGSSFLPTLQEADFNNLNTSSYWALQTGHMVSALEPHEPKWGTLTAPVAHYSRAVGLLLDLDAAGITLKVIISQWIKFSLSSNVNWA